MICVIGSLNMDLVVTAREIPKVGVTLIGDKFATIPGGKGANQAVAAARMGAVTAMVGRIGKDMFGEELWKSLEHSGVDCSYLYADDEASTGVALISVDENAGNSIIVVPGANYNLLPKDIDQAAPAIARSSMVVLQHEIPLETVRYALEQAKEAGKITVLNPAPAYRLEDDLLTKLDFLIPNEHELAVISGMWTETEEQLLEAAKSLIAKGVKNVIVTLGAKGCLHVDAKGWQLYESFTVDAVDTTAAGDSFIGGFCATYEQHQDLVKAIEMGQKMAALSVTQKGAQTSIPTAADIEAFWG